MDYIEIIFFQTKLHYQKTVILPISGIVICRASRKWYNMEISFQIRFRRTQCACFKSNIFFFEKNSFCFNHILVRLPCLAIIFASSHNHTLMGGGGVFYHFCASGSGWYHLSVASYFRKPFYCFLLKIWFKIKIYVLQMVQKFFVIDQLPAQCRTDFTISFFRE